MNRLQIESGFLHVKGNRGVFLCVGESGAFAALSFKNLKKAVKMYRKLKRKQMLYDKCKDYVEKVFRNL